MKRFSGRPAARRRVDERLTLEGRAKTWPGVCRSGYESCADAEQHPAATGTQRREPQSEIHGQRTARVQPRHFERGRERDYVEAAHYAIEHGREVVHNEVA